MALKGGRNPVQHTICDAHPDHGGYADDRDMEQFGLDRNFHVPEAHDKSCGSDGVPQQEAIRSMSEGSNHGSPVCP